MEKSNPAKWKRGGDGKTSLVRPPYVEPRTRAPLTDDRKNRFLAAYKITGSVQKSAEMVDGTPHTRRTFMRAMADDPAFGRACEDIFEAWKEKVADVLKEEFFEGQLVPVVNKDGVVTDPDTKKPIWIRRRDSRVVLAYAKKFDFGLREIKTTVHVDGTPQVDANDPEFRVKSSDLLRLSQSDMDTLVRLLKLVHQNRRESMPEVITRPDYLDVEDIPYTEESLTAVDPDNPFDI